MSWKKQKPVEKINIGCLNCSTAYKEAPMDLLIAVGFGDAYVSKDGEIVYDGESELQAGKEPKSVGDIERKAARDPNHDWRIMRITPLHGETYQRHGKEKWVCIESNEGFA